MKNIKNYLITTGLLVVCLLVLAWVSTWGGIRIESTQAAFANHAFKPVKLPLSTDHIGNYRVKVTLTGIEQGEQQVRIYPDDEIHALSINGHNISLAGISREQRRNYSAGFVISLPHLMPGRANILEASLHNSSNPAGFNIESAERVRIDKQLSIFLLLVAIIAVLRRHLPITPAQNIIAILGILCCVSYLAVTDERTRTFDVFEGGGHKDYIEYLIEHRALPLPGDGWEYHQPPLYYLTAALVKVAAGVDSNLHGELWGQLVALFFWTCFLVSGLACLRQAFKQHQTLLLLVSLSLALWPSGIIHSIRIGNDLPLYAFYSLSFYYILRWWGSRQSKWLLWASLWMAASLMTKSNGLAVAGILGILMLLHLYGLVRKPHLRQTNQPAILRDAALAGGFFIAALALNFADNIKHYLDGTSKDWLLSNVSEMINPRLKVENTLANYLIFDSATFIEKPFISTWDDDYGRQYFWNFVWRSALSSEFFFTGKTLQTWGVINGLLLLAMLSGAIIFYLQKQPITPIGSIKRSLYRQAPWVMALIFPFILLLAYRIKVPLSCNTDFRYIYPVLVAILFFVAQSWRQSKQQNLWIPRILTLGAPLIALNSFWWVAAL